MKFEEFRKKYEGHKLYGDRADRCSGYVSFSDDVLNKCTAVYLPTQYGYGLDIKLQRKVWRELKSTGAIKVRGVYMEYIYFYDYQRKLDYIKNR